MNKSTILLQDKHIFKYIFKVKTVEMAVYGPLPQLVKDWNEYLLEKRKVEECFD